MADIPIDRFKFTATLVYCLEDILGYAGMVYMNSIITELIIKTHFQMKKGLW